MVRALGQLFQKAGRASYPEALEALEARRKAFSAERAGEKGLIWRNDRPVCAN